MFKKISHIILCVAVLSLCGCASTKDFHYYHAEHSYKVKGHFDEVWAEMIDYVAESNYEITNLEKESGIITISPCKFKAAFQIKGEQNNEYYYAVQYNRKYKGKKLYVVSHWNIRVKPLTHWVTQISVNLLDNGKVIMVDNDGKETELDLANQPTGRFEKLTLYAILDNLRKMSIYQEEFNWREYNGESN